MSYCLTIVSALLGTCAVQMKKFGSASASPRCSLRITVSAVVIVSLGSINGALAETLSDALVKAYRSNPQLNAERARQRATDENVPQALSGYRPQIVASLSGGLQGVRNLLPDNTQQGA